MQLHIDTNAVVKFTNILEKLHRSALPSAIRNTLNDAAFDVKTKTMPLRADETFKKRQPNFFKANSRFDNAQGFDVNTMQSIVGFTEESLNGGNNFAVKDLEQQESGGAIDKKSFIPMDPARTGSNTNKPVRANARLKQIKIIKAKNAKGVNQGQKFIKSLFFAGVGGSVLSIYKGKETLWRVNSLRRNDDGSFKLTPTYNFKQGRKVNVKPTHFMEKASLATADKLDRFYIKQAQRQIEKFMH